MKAAPTGPTGLTPTMWAAPPAPSVQAVDGPTTVAGEDFTLDFTLGR